MGVKIREKAGKLYLDIYQKGKRSWEALGLTLTKDRAQNREIHRLAEICRSKREAQLLSVSWDIQDTLAGKKKITGYLEEISGTKPGARYIKGCIRYLKRFGEKGNISIAHITPQWIDAFQKFLLNETGLARSSASAYSRAVRYALRKAVQENILVKNPAESVKSLPEPEGELVFLNVGELQRLAGTPLGGKLGGEVRLAFVFACYTGLRISDIKNLKWADIETEPLQIIKKQKKTKSTVCIPLKEAAWDIIKDNVPHASDEPVFRFISGTKSSTNGYLKKWAKAAGINKPMGWHTARRTFATLALENGADIYTVSKLLGHRGLAQVARYAEATSKLKRAAVEGLPALTVD